jgi:hypothetical protein
MLESEDIAAPFLTRALHGGEWAASRLCPAHSYSYVVSEFSLNMDYYYGSTALCWALAAFSVS